MRGRLKDILKTLPILDVCTRKHDNKIISVTQSNYKRNSLPVKKVSKGKKSTYSKQMKVQPQSVKKNFAHRRM